MLRTEISVGRWLHKKTSFFHMGAGNSPFSMLQSLRSHRHSLCAYSDIKSSNRGSFFNTKKAPYSRNGGSLLSQQRIATKQRCRRLDLHQRRCTLFNPPVHPPQGNYRFLGGSSALVSEHTVGRHQSYGSDPRRLHAATCCDIYGARCWS